MLEIRLFFIPLPWVTEDLLGDWLLEIAQIVNSVIKPFGYVVVNYALIWDERYISIYVEKTGSPAIPVGAILAALAVFFGVIFYWVQVIDLEKRKVELEQMKTVQETQQELIEAGVEPKEATRLVRQAYEGVKETTKQDGFGWDLRWKEVMEMFPTVLFMILMLTLIAYIPRPRRG
jgi:hypothetical protein